jgi:lysophospholipase L1-like esterase
LLALVAGFASHESVCASQSQRWVGSWASAQMIPNPDDTVPRESFHNATLRQIVHLSVGGSRIRVRLTNTFGTTPLHLTAAHLARPVSSGSSRIDPASDHAITFNDETEVSIPAGAEYTSDPLDYAVTPQSDLAISLQMEAVPEQETGHPGAHATSYLAANLPVSATELPTARTYEHWYFLSGVEVSASAATRVAIALGDSITDGHGSTTNGNDRWTDDLVGRLQSDERTRDVALLNQGIGGNRLLTDGWGPSVLARLDRDVFSQAGTRYLIVLEGINDIGMLTHSGPATAAQHEDLVQRMIGAYRQITLRAHAHSLKVIGATLLPFMGSDYYHPGMADEHDRQSVNAWIRAPGHFDAVVDFDKVTADPAHPDRLRAAHDSGDHLHPSPAGYRAMADAIPLELIR